jgi:hypothetical protein
MQLMPFPDDHPRKWKYSFVNTADESLVTCFKSSFCDNLEFGKRCYRFVKVITLIYQ